MFFFFNDTATTEIYTLSLHDALPILAYDARGHGHSSRAPSPSAYTYEDLVADLAGVLDALGLDRVVLAGASRSEEHTSELQSRQYLVCRLLLEKKTTTYSNHAIADMQ